MKIGITYNLKDELSPGALLDDEFIEEFDTRGTIDALCDVLSRAGHEPVRLGCNIDMVERIKAENVGFVFNIAEGYSGRNRESHVPSILEMLDVPYSGSDPLTMGLTLDKIMTKKIAMQAGILVPPYKVVRDLSDLRNIEKYMEYPLISKPAWEGSSKGIYNSSRVYNRMELEESVASLLKKYPGQPALVEQYIKGREITAGVIGNDPPRVIGLMEIINKKSPGEDMFYSLEVKRDWKNLVDYESPPDTGEALDRHIRHYALSAFKEFGCRDIARIDFRISGAGDIYMLEINPLPGLSPEYADLVIMAKKQGISFENLVAAIMQHSLARYGMTESGLKAGKQDANYETV